MNLPSVFYPFVIGSSTTFTSYAIGKQGNTKKRIEKETGTVLTLPHKGEEDAKVVIKGPTKNSIINAHARIEIIVDTVSKHYQQDLQMEGNQISTLHSFLIHTT
jgi:hypothetical protein